MDLSGHVRVANGPPTRSRTSDTPVDSPGARLIIEESQLGLDG